MVLNQLSDKLIIVVHTLIEEAKEQIHKVFVPQGISMITSALSKLMILHYQIYNRIFFSFQLFPIPLPTISTLCQHFPSQNNNFRLHLNLLNHLHFHLCKFV